MLAVTHVLRSMKHGEKLDGGLNDKIIIDVSRSKVLSV